MTNPALKFPFPVMTGLVPVIHVVKPPERFGLTGSGAAWMAGTSPAMTEREGAFEAAQRATPRKDGEGSARASVRACAEIV